ncbi:MAG: GH116 family glycosyl-hydrolase [Lentisphaeria bacterium]|nr:GH116 family glycosyl-hydrolase [Lentisphaeria bacterium]
MDHSSWPYLKSYDTDHLRKIAMPIGGIGTGTVSLGGRGDLRDWEIMNTPAKGYTPVLAGLKNLGSFFALSALHDGRRVARCLEGPIDSSDYEASEGCKTPNSGFPRFPEAVFHAAYPLGVVELLDEQVPLNVELRAMNPMIPGDSSASSLPCAMLIFHLENPTDSPVEASICGTFLNPVGCDGRQTKPAWGSRTQYLGLENNETHALDCDYGSRLHLISTAEDTGNEAYGEICVTAAGGRPAGSRVSWPALSWGDSILDFWDEFSMTGETTPRENGPQNKLLSSMARTITLAPGQSGEIRFLVTWRFPNRKGWSKTVVGNDYAERFPTSVAAADYVLDHWDSLRDKTLDFVRAFCDSDVPTAVKEAALFNSGTLRTQTCFQTPDGHFFGWEGIHDFVGSCPGSCTHVWNYEQTTAYLFADLSRGMREVEFLHATNDEGAMRFRNLLPLSKNTEEPWSQAAADGQMGCIMKIYRDWRLSGDDTFLSRLWPKVKAALAFAWVPGGWDTDRDGVMEGCQHNTMDVDYYGPNPQMQGWYLGALKAAEKMAAYLTETGQADDGDFARRCRELFDKGREWTDRELFNGDYYDHRIQVPTAIHPLTTNHHGLEADGSPILQLGKGCLIDQLAGQYMAHVCGLGYILDPDHVKTTLSSILKYNLKRGFHDHFNHLRNYALGDETAVLMGTYPHGDRPRRPFPYYNEVMTGFEHTLAAHLIYEGMIDEGVALVGYIRDRYDGRKRSPFDEAECGHHYARAMAAWAEVLAFTGFHYSAVDKTMTFNAPDGTYFWSTGTAWGTCAITDGKGELTTLYGEAAVEKLVINGR